MTLLENRPARIDLDRPRLPIDRVFSMSGFDTVVTGTLSDGHLSVGDEVEILPSGQRGRIRGLQTHRKKEEVAVPGSRTAVNVSGVETELIQRGEVLVHPNQYEPTRRVDARLRVLKDISAPVKHNSEVKLFVGASETIGTLRLLDTEELQPGAESWIQLELRDPIVTVRGDRFVLRRPSPGETLGGGVIVDHQPKGRHKRFDNEILKSLEAVSHGTPAEILFEAALASGAAPIKEIVNRSRLEASSAEAALNELLLTNSLVPLEDGQPTATGDLLAIAVPQWKALHDKTLQTTESYHKAYPLRSGIPREELKSRLKLSSRVFSALINKLLKEQELVERGMSLAKREHEVTFDSSQQAKVQTLNRKFEQNPFSPPGVKESQVEVGEEVLNALIENGSFVSVSADVIFRKPDYDAAVARIGDALAQQGTITLAQVRDLFGTSRKYAQALLEHLDAIGMTTRDGDYRKLRRK
jgi:selenocysteine-specific elongation factor